MTFSIRQARAPDLASICAVDSIVRTDAGRQQVLQRAIAEGHCFLLFANPDQGPVAYAILEYSFYGYGFISLLYVDKRYRRQNCGAALMEHLERHCQTEKLFTSTNESNLAMQGLLSKLGYKRSGVIYNLDEGDPELVYCKILSQTAV